MNILDRFAAKYEVDASGCWLWTGRIDRHGYGHFSLNGSMELAHRCAYQLFVRPIPDGLTIDHLKDRGCVHRHCVNPEHLEAVTKRENILRGIGPTAINARKTHCVHGHPFDDESTLLRARGRRACRACNRAASTRYRIRLREAA